MKRNSLRVARTEGGDDVRPLAESGSSIENLFKGMTLVDLVQKKNGRVQLAVSWRKVARNEVVHRSGGMRRGGWDGRGRGRNGKGGRDHAES